MPASPAPVRVRRVIVPPAPLPANGNIFRRYAIEHAEWIWHPELPARDTAHVVFRRRFQLARPAKIRLHTSADQRYVLRIDGQTISRGPHRSDLQHWSFESHVVTLPPGRHVFEATVWWLPEEVAPFAQISWRAGFILAAEGEHGALLDTGRSRWEVRRLDGIAFRNSLPFEFHVVGPGYDFDGPKFHQHGRWVRATPLKRRWHHAPRWFANGTLQRGWTLHPSPLADSRWPVRPLGQVRALACGAPPAGTERFTAVAAGDPLAAQIDRLLAGQAPLKIAAHTQLRAVIDLGDYYCGFPQLTLRGRGRVTLEWAESLFTEHTPYGKATNKGDRNVVDGKFFHGFGDSFHHAGPRRSYSPFWWRAGRYWLLTVETETAPLLLESLALEEDSYPFARLDRFACDRPQWNHVQKILWRGITTGAHETFTDSPYYEQMMYVGDARLESLCHYLCAGCRVHARRGLELFDWSRWRTGFVAERYPSDPFQLSLTYSMLWVSMLREYAWWQDDDAFVRERLLGARSLFEHFLPLRDERGLLVRLPGWSYVDTANSTWKRGLPPGERQGGSASVNLQFLLMLQDLAALEKAFGDPLLARRVDLVARDTAAAIRRVFWHAGRHLLAEDSDHTVFSEHAQSLGLLAGLFRAGEKRRVVNHLLADRDLARCSIYFTHYWLDAMRSAGRGDELVRKLDEWSSLPKRGFKAAPEEMHLGRSDNHGWSCHPLYHYHASLAGIRPSSPGFKTVEVAPLPGPLQRLHSRVPHALGPIVAKLDFDGDACTGSVTLPTGLTGSFRWRGKTQALRSGLNHIR